MQTDRCNKLCQPVEVKKPPPGYFLTVRALTKTLGDSRVLRDLELRLPAASSLAILGSSGSGKTTLLQLLAGLELPDGGDILYRPRAADEMGREVRLNTLSEDARTLFRRRRLGIVFQFFNLIPTLTVEENLMLPLVLTGRRKRREHLEEWSRRLDVVHLWRRIPEELSGGEQQRVAVLRALVHGPDLVLADEPTGNLDAANGAEVLAMLLELVRSDGTSLVLVTHNERAAREADQMLILQNGTLVPASSRQESR